MFNWTPEQITTLINSSTALISAIGVVAAAFFAWRTKQNVTAVSKKTDDIHVLVNKNHEAAQQRIGELIQELSALNEKRVADQKEATQVVSDVAKVAVSKEPVS